MKQRILAAVLTLCMLATMLPQMTLFASANSDTDIAYAVEGGNIYFDKSTGTITACDDSVTEANIPAQIDGVAVTSIGDRAFANRTSLTSVNIPNGVTSIGNDAFYWCTNLTSVNIPDSVTSIGDGAFALCYILTGINIPNSISNIGRGVFQSCHELTSVSIPNNITSIGAWAFDACSNLTSVSISSSVTSIGDWAFAETPSLTSVYFYGNAPAIGEDLFYWSGGDDNIIRTVTLYYINGKSGWTTPTWEGYPTATWSGESAYPVVGGNIYFNKETGTITGCDESVTKADIPAKIDGIAVTAISDGAFHSCNNLTGVTLPDSITTIGHRAFEECSSLIRVAIPGNVSSIGMYAFRACESLTEIRVDKANPNYCSDDQGVLFDKDKTYLIQAPGAISGAYTIPDGVTEIGTAAFFRCHNLIGVNIPNSVISIYDSAFQSSGLTDVTIPSSVTFLGSLVFTWCNHLEEIRVNEANPNYSSDARGVLFNKDKTKLMQAPGAISGAYMIPDGVTDISDSAFRDCGSLADVVIPDSVTSIGYAAFQCCNKLTSVYFCGDAPRIDSSVFFTFDEADEFILPNVTLYYIDGKAGWTTPTWNGYPTATWDGTVPVTVKFDDVVDGKWYVNAVQFAYDNGVFAGVDDTHFNPNGKTTRAMFVAVLWRLDGRPESSGKNPFVDVKSSDYFAKAVIWAAENKIVAGADATHFNPNGNVTREQVAAFLYRYSRAKGYDLTTLADLSAFPDAGKVEAYAQTNLSWAVGSGLISGNKDNATGIVYLDPKGNATRAQVAQILMKFTQNVAQ